MFSAVLARNAANLLKYSLLSGFNWCRYCPVRRTGTYFGDGTPYRHSWCHSGATCKISQRYQFFTHHVLKYSHRKTHKTFTNYNYVFFCVCIFCLLFGDVYGFQNRCSTDCPERLVSLKWSVQSLVCWVGVGLRLRSHTHECESESGFPCTGRLSLVQASPARVERSRPLVQAHNSTRVCWQSPVKSTRMNALRKSNSILLQFNNDMIYDVK